MIRTLHFAVCGLLAIFLLSCQSTGDGPTTTVAFAEDVSEAPAADTGQADPSATEGLIPAVIGLPPEPGEAARYRIGTDDLLQVDVFQAEELSRKYRVSESGVIVMPLIGAVEIGGLTPPEAQDVIAAALQRRYLQDPQVSVFVEEYASRTVTVAGAVEKPGVYPVTPNTTLLQAVALGGGVTRVAKEDQVILFRPRDGGAMQAYVVDLKKIEKGELRDPELIAKDRVVVPTSGTLVFVKGITDALRGFVRPLYF